MNYINDLNSIWSDKYTRALFVEFNIFNPGSGLANLVIILLELPTNGDNVWSTRIETVQLYRYSGLYYIASKLKIMIISLLSKIWHLSD